MPTDQEQSQYPFRINDQYVKDLSFENPNYLMKYSDDGDKQPEEYARASEVKDQVGDACHS